MTSGNPHITQLAIALLTMSGVAVGVLSDGYTPFLLALVALTVVTGVGLGAVGRRELGMTEVVEPDVVAVAHPRAVVTEAGA